MKSMHKPLKLNIQFFAGETKPPAGDPPADTKKTEDDPAGGDPPAKVELTQTELDKKIEAEADRKLSKALEKKQAEWQEQQQQAIKDALENEKRLSKLSEKERKDEELTTREKQIQQRLQVIERKELKADVVSDLSEKGLPSTFADFLLADNAENTLKNINAFKEAYDKAVNETVKQKLRQDPPRTGDSRKPSGSEVSKAEMARKARIIK